jgi:HJR/Mrr/RecB family endonuclease
MWLQAATAHAANTHPASGILGVMVAVLGSRVSGNRNPVFAQDAVNVGAATHENDVQCVVENTIVAPRRHRDLEHELQAAAVM